MMLDEYLMARLGEEIPKISVLSADKKVRGYVEGVEWNKFPNGDYDIERSWVRILWQNGNESWNSIDFMGQVEVLVE